MDNSAAKTELRKLIRDFKRCGDRKRLRLAERTLRDLADATRAGKTADRSCLKVEKRLNAAMEARDDVVKADLTNRRLMRRLIVRFHTAFEAAWDAWDVFQCLIKVEERTLAKCECAISQLSGNELSGGLFAGCAIGSPVQAFDCRSADFGRLGGAIRRGELQAR